MSLVNSSPFLTERGIPADFYLSSVPETVGICFTIADEDTGDNLLIHLPPFSFRNVEVGKKSRRPASLTRPVAGYASLRRA